MAELQRYLDCGATWADCLGRYNDKITYTNESFVNTAFGKRYSFANGGILFDSISFTSYMYWYNGDSYAYDGTDSYKNGVVGSEVITIESTGFSGVTGWVGDLVYFDRVITEQEILNYNNNSVFNYIKTIYTNYNTSGSLTTAPFDTTTKTNILNNVKSDGVTSLGLTAIQLTDFRNQYCIEDNL